MAYELIISKEAHRDIDEITCYIANELKKGTTICVHSTKSILSKSLNAFKSLTSRQFGESMWQRSYQDHIIRNEAGYHRIWSYIDGNPILWNEDEYFI